MTLAAGVRDRVHDDEWIRCKTCAGAGVYWDPQAGCYRCPDCGDSSADHRPGGPAA